MNIFVIHGSPHNGNTLKLTQRFEEKMKKLGDVKFSYASLKDLNIQMCKGCFNCIQKGEELCPLKDDDIKFILENIEKADGIIVSAPTYMYNIPALMKILIDRLSYFGHRPKFLNKSAIVISTTYGIGLSQALKYLAFGTIGAWGLNLIGKLGTEINPFVLNEKGKIKLDKKISKLAMKFYKKINQDSELSVSFSNLMRFRTMKTISYYIKELFPADYKFYHENKNIGKSYYNDSVKINPFKKIISNIFSGLMARSLRKSRKKTDIYQKFLDW